MVELYPASFAQLLRRMFWEYEHEKKIFDLPVSKFFRGDNQFDTNVDLHGLKASTPVGPAAGPQSQLAQNIVLSWLAGARIIEFKTVQINDELKIPRPCIDATNVGYNVEWSQELKLQQSLQEYVAGSMLIDILTAAGIPGTTHTDTIFDMSVGYDLAGIRSPQVTQWMEQLRDASRIVEQLRQQIPDEFKQFRDLNFRTQISNSITLSTFHGCPAHEIERIGEYLLNEMDIHTIIKMNPTLLGREAVEHLLHDVMGYQDIRVTQEAFDKDLQFDQALEICTRLKKLAAQKGKKLGVKFSNTLVVQNHRTFFSDKEMYLSGAPLHVITLNLVKKFRAIKSMADIPISFSAGIDQQNFPEGVAQGFVPVTTCTDLLRPGGYGRLPGYLTRLYQKMKALNVHNIPDFIMKSEGQGLAALDAELTSLPNRTGPAWSKFSEISRDEMQDLQTTLREDVAAWLTESKGPLSNLFDNVLTKLPFLKERFSQDAIADLAKAMAELHKDVVNHAARLNTDMIVPRTTADLRYAQAKNHAVPRKIGSQLWIYDCINCDKCIPVCPNDANFAYEIAPFEAECQIYQVHNSQLEMKPGRTLKVAKSHQIGNFADFCNECGNCDIFCPEDGGPYLEKPRFFGTLDTMRLHNDRDGCFFERTVEEDRAYGRFKGQEYLLTVSRKTGQHSFTDGFVTLNFDKQGEHQCQATVTKDDIAEHQLDSYYYHLLSSLLKGIMDTDKINYLNMAHIGQQIDK